MALNFEDYRQVNSQILAAALDNSRWSSALRTISAKAGNFPVHVYGADTSRNVSYGHLTFGYDPAHLETYKSYFADKNPWIEGFATMNIGVSTPSYRMCPDAALTRTEFYNDWLLPQEDIMGGGGAILRKSQTGMFVIGGNIRRRDRDRLEAPWLETISQLISPLMHAWSISLTMAQGVFERSLLRKCNAIDPAILVFGPDGKINFANARASNLLADGKLVRVDLRGKIVFSTISAQVAVNRISSHSRSGTGVTTANVQLPDGSKLLLSEIDPSVLCDWRAVEMLGLDEPCLLAVISSPLISMPVADRLKNKFGLTPSEADVAVKFSTGMTLHEISEARTASIHTVRHQLKSAMHKVGLNRQADFASFLVRLANHYLP